MRSYEKEAQAFDASIEGNLYEIKHKIDNQAVKGALLSIAVSWQISILFSENREDTAVSGFLLCPFSNILKKLDFFITLR